MNAPTAFPSAGRLLPLQLYGMSGGPHRKKSQACVGVQLAANRTTKFTLRYRQDPYTALAATWVTNSTEVSLAGSR
mgnify:CR=1 FL=1